MRRRVLATLVAAGAIAAAVGAAPSAIAGPATTSTCPSGQICVWSGANYTGTRAIVSQDPWTGCVTSASLGLDGIRSAKRNGVPCSIQSALYADSVCGRETTPFTIQTNTPTISPAALSLENFQIPC